MLFCQSNSNPLSNLLSVQLIKQSMLRISQPTKYLFIFVPPVDALLLYKKMGKHHHLKRHNWSFTGDDENIEEWIDQIYVQAALKIFWLFFTLLYIFIFFTFHCLPLWLGPAKSNNGGNKKWCQVGKGEHVFIIIHRLVPKRKQWVRWVHGFAGLLVHHFITTHVGVLSCANSLHCH